MNFTQSFKLAINALRTSKMRALLTMLGIIIGVAAVIVILSLGNGMQGMMNEQFEKLGATLIQVQVFSDGTGTRDVTAADMYNLVEKYPDQLSAVSPYMIQQPKVREGNDDFKVTSVYGVSEAFYYPDKQALMSGEKLGEGRFLQYIDVERRQNVCVIGSYLAQEAFQGDALGRAISIGGTPYTVIGVLAQDGDNTEGSGNDVAYIPYGCAQEMGGSMYSLMFMVNATSKDSATAAKGIIENLLFQAYQTSDMYFVMTSAEMMDSMNMMMSTMMLILVAIAAISLVVGGIGIMNIMLVSVTERTREIGVRKSLGAKRRDIRMQFIIEAGTTSAIGGLLGIVFGVLLAAAASTLVGGFMASQMGGGSFNAVPTVGAVAVSFGVSVAIGILFGYLPANKAAKLNPIDALRYD